MYKKDIIDVISEKTGYSEHDVDIIISLFMDTIVESVSDGDTVRLTGFGNFVAVERAARKGRDMSTDSIIDIPATVIPRFKPSSVFKDIVKSRNK